MESQTILALAAYGAAGSFTPGPNNLMLMTSGTNFGIRRSLRHLAGVCIGFTLMVLVIGVGLAGLFEAWPPALKILTAVSVAYTLWLAWKIANAGRPSQDPDEGTRGRPLGFRQAAAFQWVNPKAWTMGLSTITLFAPDQELRSVLIITGVYGLLTIGSTWTWLVMGLSIRRWLSSDARLKAFNYTMALLLVLSIGLALL
jgi:threonine/homoserine/homoserine lactone efflux protein